MQLGSKFQQLSVLKAARVAHRKQPQFDKYLAVAQAHTKRLNATVADLEARADTTQKQKADGEAFRGERRSAKPPQACGSLCELHKADPASSAVILDNDEGSEAAHPPLQLNQPWRCGLSSIYATTVLTAKYCLAVCILGVEHFYLPGLPTSCLLLLQSAS